MQIAPIKELVLYIKHYLFLESESDFNFKKLRLFSDGNTGMVFTFATNFYVNNSDTKIFKYPDSFLYGQISAFKDLFLTKNTKIIIVVFQPYGINHLLGIPAIELRDEITSITELLGKNGEELYERLSEESKLDLRLNILNNFFIEQVIKRQSVNKNFIPSLLSFILKNKGQVTSNQLENYSGYTERHIQRIFKESIGLNPKKYGNIVMLHNFLNLLKSRTIDKNLTNLSYEAGYADQAHLIREFKKYTGITPTEYLNNTSRLAVNFFEIKLE